MNGRRAIVGLCMACALLVSAFAAQGASAAPSTTAFTCKAVATPGPDGTKGFKDEHCKEATENKSPELSNVKFEHKEFAANTTTSLRGRSVGASKLKSTIAGASVTLESTELEGVGSPWLTNMLSESNEHWATGEGKITYKGVTVAGNAKCFVYEDGAGKAIGEKEMVTTEQLHATTQGQGMGVKFTPAAAGPFARFYILDKNKKTSAEGGECNIGATYVVSGSLIATPEGATLVTTEEGVTAQNTLKMGPTEAGAKAALEGKLTLEAEDTTDPEDTWAPISSTTVTE